jgi:hypothetical protein
MSARQPYPAMEAWIADAQAVPYVPDDDGSGFNDGQPDEGDAGRDEPIALTMRA